MLAGGGTGMIGDPSGRSSERNLLSQDQIAANLVKIRQQLALLLDFDVKSNPARLVNNYDWLSKIDMITFLRDVGKHFTINYMLAKDSVKGRIDRGGGVQCLACWSAVWWIVRTFRLAGMVEGRVWRFLIHDLRRHDRRHFCDATCGNTFRSAGRGGLDCLRPNPHDLLERGHDRPSPLGLGSKEFF